MAVRLAVVHCLEAGRKLAIAEAKWQQVRALGLLNSGKEVRAHDASADVDGLDLATWQDSVISRCVVQVGST